MSSSQEIKLGFSDDFKIKYGVHVVFSTIPSEKTKDFVSTIEKKFYKEYKDKNNSADNFLYKPLKYFMLGDYDICFLSLINNFKFAHRLFEPIENYDESYRNNAHTFQSYSGFALNQDEVYLDYFKNKPSNLIGVIHLKVNNGLFIGNGIELIEVIQKYLENGILKGKKFILSQTFSWFEISLMIFIDEPQELTDIIISLRRAKFEDIYSQSLHENSLYSLLEKGKNIEIIKNVSLFSDTNSNIGFHSSLIESKEDEKDYIDYIDFKELLNNNQNIKLKTEIEWQVKPGHFRDLVREVKKIDCIASSFDFNNPNLVLGKCDYMIQETEDNLLTNLELIRAIYCDDCSLFNFARKVRTYVFLTPNKPEIEENETRDYIEWKDIFQHLAIKSSSFKEVDKNLKELKVSRQVRLKVLKILSNYNNGITDPILFPYFLDFKVFIESLKKTIAEDHKKSIQFHHIEIKTLEKKLVEYIDTFQEAYTVRFLNGYQFENISDFDLDFNNSVQQLLTSYGVLVYEYGKMFFQDPVYYPVIQLNNIDTQSDLLSINYAAHHLTSPEFVFTTLTKEILNNLKEDKGEYDSENAEEINPKRVRYNDVYEQYKKSIIKLKRKINESYFDDLLKSKMIDLNYFIIDIIRFEITFNKDFKLFEHWFWSYSFQNTSLYDTNGMFNEQHLRMEIFRLMLVQKYYTMTKKEFMEDVFSPIHKPLECPSPEVYTYWILHIEKINKITNEIFSHKNLTDDFFVIINELLEVVLTNYKVEIETVNSKIKYFQENVLEKTLNEYYLDNKRKMTLLKRDWNTGIPIPKYNKLYENKLFAIDQMGGVYFSNLNKAQIYFEKNAKCLAQIIDFGAKYKKDFISKYI